MNLNTVIHEIQKDNWLAVRLYVNNGDAKTVSVITRVGKFHRFTEDRNVLVLTPHGSTPGILAYGDDVNGKYHLIEMDSVKEIVVLNEDENYLKKLVQEKANA